MGRRQLVKEARRAGERTAQQVFPGAVSGWKMRAFDVLCLRGFWGRMRWLVLGR